MSNLAGKIGIRFTDAARDANAAVEEWHNRVGTFMPGDIPIPRNTLRGHPQPWRTRPSTTLTDTGVLKHSTYQGLSDGTTYLPKERFPHLTGRRGGTGRSRGSHANLTSSTAALARGEWEGRVADGTSTIRNGTRGSMAPNWKPLSQEDLTGTGSVDLKSWGAGTSAYKVPGTLTMRELLASSIPDKPRNTWSTATLQRNEWEDRLDKHGVGVPLA